MSALLFIQFLFKVSLSKNVIWTKLRQLKVEVKEKCELPRPPRLHSTLPAYLEYAL